MCTSFFWISFQRVEITFNFFESSIDFSFYWCYFVPYFINWSDYIALMIKINILSWENRFKNLIHTDHRRLLLVLSSVFWAFCQFICKVETSHVSVCQATHISTMLFLSLIRWTKKDMTDRMERTSNKHTTCSSSCRRKRTAMVKVLFFSICVSS